MDVAYLFRHSAAGDRELRFSLRSVAKHLPWVRKVFVFGDRPGFLSDDCSVIEHVPWESLAWLGGFRTPAENWLLQAGLLSLWPGLSDEFLIFHDDHVLLGDVSDAMARRQRYVEDLAACRERGRGKWQAQLWRTYDWLRERNSPTYNFESLTPRYVTKRRLFAAFAGLREFASEDRFGGLLGPTAILNHALQRENFAITHRADENLTIGFTVGPAIYDDVVLRTTAKRFLYFNEKRFQRGPAPVFGGTVSRTVPVRSRHVPTGERGM